MKFYGKTLKFKRGVYLNMTLLYACNLPCEYCSLELPTGKRPRAKQLGIEDWKKIVAEFPAKIKEIGITGGEPSMVRWMPDFCNWLLDRGYHVTIYSNLYKPEEYLRIKKSYRLQILSTFHSLYDNEERFDKAYRLLKDKHNVNVVEFEGDFVLHGKNFTSKKMLPYSKLSKLETDDIYLQADREFRYSPDGHLFTSCYNHYSGKQ